MFAHFGRLLLELMKFGTLSESQMREHMDVEGGERVQQAYQQGRGVLYFTGHFGYWEMQAIAHPLHLRPMSVLARPLDNPYLHEMLERIRTCTGNGVIYRQGAIRKVMRELAANRGVAFLIDQHLHSADAVYVDFFDRPAATTSALAALALRTGAPVIPVFALPLPGGRYRFIYESRCRRRTRNHPTRSVSSRSDAPTCSRCTCVAIRRCGCGCIAAGAIAIRGLPARLRAATMR